MTRMTRIGADPFSYISANPRHPRHPRSVDPYTDM